MHIEIPEACHENWQEMTPQDKGRFCDKCCKVVVDFTNMATEKVIDFLSGKKDERVFGRFRPDQVKIPVEQKNNSALTKRMKLFLAAVVLVFGGILFTGCGIHHEKMGKVKSDNFSEQNFQRNNYDVEKDTTVKKIPLKGKVCIATDTVMPTGGAVAVPDKDEPKLMGKPAVNPK